MILVEVVRVHLWQLTVRQLNSINPTYRGRLVVMMPKGIFVSSTSTVMVLDALYVS